MAGTVNVDIDSLTLGEIEIVEEITGLGIDEIAETLGKPGPKAKLLVALAFVSERRTNPAVTLDEVRAMEIDLAASDPKGPAGSAKRPGSPSRRASRSVRSIAS